MRGVNKVILVGTLGRDPESKTFPNGGSVCNFSIATSESWTDKATGERKEQTEWHRIVLNNRLGEVAQQYLRKGSKVYIEGSLRTRQWTDQNGQERYTTEIRGDQMQMLDSRQQQQDGGWNQQQGNNNFDAPRYSNNPSQGGYGGNVGGYGAAAGQNQGPSSAGYGGGLNQATPQAPAQPRPAAPASNEPDDDLPF